MVLPETSGASSICCGSGVKGRYLFFGGNLLSKYELNRAAHTMLKGFPNFSIEKFIGFLYN
jgi:hypothetical protein